MTFRKELLLNFMSDRLGVDTVDVDEDTPLFSSGMIDSVGMTELIGFVESESNVTFGPDDITLDNLDSIGRILGFLRNGHDQQR